MHHPNSGTFLPNSYKNGWTVTRDRFLANVLVKSKPKIIKKVVKFKNLVLTTDKAGFVSNQFVDRLQSMKINSEEIELDTLKNEGGKVENIDIFNLVSMFTGRTELKKNLFHLKTFDAPVWQHVEYTENFNHGDGYPVPPKAYTKVMRYNHAIDLKKNLSDHFTYSKIYHRFIKNNV